MSPSKGPYCPECNKPATGNFCQSCGANLGGRFCNHCGSKVAGSAKFCNQCGNTVADAPGAGRAAAHKSAAKSTFTENLPWWIAGVAMFAAIMVLGTSMVRPGGPVAPAAGTPAAAGTPPDISQMTPIEAADRLFDRVMRSSAEGDSASAQAFLPMAIAAYQRAEPLNYDGLYHLATLNLAAGNLEAALDDAVRVLEEEPDHLLALGAAAQASIELGETDEADRYYQHLLEVFETEQARPLDEYVGHRAIVDALKLEAESYLGGR